MNFLEAIKLARGGKKIRCIDWDQKVFIYLDQITLTLHWSNNDPFILFYSHSIAEWEEYEVKETEIEIKLINFQEALKAFKEGKTIKRYKYSSMLTRGRLFTTEPVFSCEDVFADDWIIMEIMG